MNADVPAPQDRKVHWIGSSKKDFLGFPADVHRAMGFALHLAQTGLHPPSAKPLKGFPPGTVELIADHDGDTYRAVYTVKYREVVYVLHAFQKKSKRGIATPKADLDLIKQRLRRAELAYADAFGKDKGK